MPLFHDWESLATGGVSSGKVIDPVRSITLAVKSAVKIRLTVRSVPV